LSFFDKIGKLDGTGSFVEQVAGGFFASDNLKDYTHASKLFRSDGYGLAPNFKFLFHVYFTLENPAASPSDDRGLVGALVKSISLPSFEVETQEYVQYNRKRLVHSKINYRPVEIKMHDDSSDTVRSLWYNYYNYYFADPSYNYESGQGGYSGRDIYNLERGQDNWGMSTTSPNGLVKAPFFKDIQIYGMSRGNYIKYTLINPVITDWRGDTYDYSAGNGVMEHNVTVKFEAVKYERGRVGDENMNGFGVPSRYDTSPSPLGAPGNTASIFGQSGALDTVQGVTEDLANGNFLGAIQKAGRSIKTFKNAPLSFSQILKEDLKTEALQQGRALLTRSNKGRSVSYGTGKPVTFPKIGDLFKGNGNKPATPKAGPAATPGINSDN